MTCSFIIRKEHKTAYHFGSGSSCSLPWLWTNWEGGFFPMGPAGVVISLSWPWVNGQPCYGVTWLLYLGPGKNWAYRATVTTCWQKKALSQILSLNRGKASYTLLLDQISGYPVKEVQGEGFCLNARMGAVAELVSRAPGVDMLSNYFSKLTSAVTFTHIYPSESKGLSSKLLF